MQTIYILAANLGCLLIINVITFRILLDGGVLIVEPNLAVIAGETVGNRVTKFLIYQGFTTPSTSQESLFNLSFI